MTTKNTISKNNNSIGLFALIASLVIIIFMVMFLVNDKFPVKQATIEISIKSKGHIIRPDGYGIKYGEMISLAGHTIGLKGKFDSAADIARKNLSWHSDRDGTLGYGSELRTNKLSRGLHRISYSATELSGKLVSTFIYLSVGQEHLSYNIAHEAAVLASSSYCGGGEAHCYFANRINDGDTSTLLGGQHSWSNDQDENPHTVTLSWSEDVRLENLELYTTTGYEIQDFKIQYLADEQWMELVNVVGNKNVSMSYVFAPIITRQLRVIGIKGPDKQKNHVRINELIVKGYFLKNVPITPVFVKPTTVVEPINLYEYVKMTEESRINIKAEKFIVELLAIVSLLKTSFIEHRLSSGEFPRNLKEVGLKKKDIANENHLSHVFFYGDTLLFILNSETYNAPHWLALTENTNALGISQWQCHTSVRASSYMPNECESHNLPPQVKKNKLF